MDVITCVLTVPGASTPGQRMTATTRMPPS